MDDEYQAIASTSRVSSSIELSMLIDRANEEELINDQAVLTLPYRPHPAELDEEECFGE